MIFEQKYRIGVEDIGVDNYLSNHGLLAFLEDIACYHAATVGFGILDVKRNQKAWILLEWNAKIIKRPLYNETVLVKTWVSSADRLICVRDFEVLSETGEELAIASSKWVLMDMNVRRMVKLTEEYVGVYGIEEGRRALAESYKFIEPEQYDFSTNYALKRSDIDMNHHLHNLNYVDIAYEMLPAEVYETQKFNHIIVEYKKEITWGEEITCSYAHRDKEHIVTFQCGDKLHAAVIFS